MRTTLRQRSTRNVVLAAALLGILGAAGAATVEQKAALGAYGSYLVSQGLDRSAPVADTQQRAAVKAVARSGEAPAGAYGSYLAERGLDRRDAATAAAPAEGRAVTAQNEGATQAR